MMNYTGQAMNKLESIQSDMLRSAETFLKTENDMVFGEGNADAAVMLVGEAPGAEETRLKRPFVGQAGKNLDQFLKVIGLERCDIYITNVVKFRPYKISAKGTVSNRPPTRTEIACMQPHLMREIETVAPAVVVTLGNTPLQSVLQNPRATIGACHAAPLGAKALTHAFTMFPLYHPASVIYNPSLKTTYANDLDLLKRFLQNLGAV